jgi:hypothetical protein
VDAHYTPSAIAHQMAAVSRQTSIRQAADFAAGDGALLRAVRHFHAGAALSGTDCHHPAVAQLKAAEPEWNLSVCDFLSPRSRAATGALRKRPKFDLIMLNPPFSYRGQAGYPLMLAGRDAVRVSPAAGFVLVATDYLAERGELIALLPLSTLSSEKDADLWDRLRGRWLVEIAAELGSAAFVGLATKTVIVRVARKPQAPSFAPRESDRVSAVRYPRIEVAVVRGCVPRHTAAQDQGGRPFIHTTNLTREGLREVFADVRSGRCTAGPAVLVPRVGNPVAWKVQVRDDPTPAVLSDCVIALQCRTREDANLVAERLRRNWTIVAAHWSGSCAPYVTLQRLKALLDGVGVDVVLSESLNCQTPEARAA